MAIERLTIGPNKSHRAIVESLDDNPTLMHKAVVEAAQAQQVGLPGLAAVSPVVDMVGIHEAGIGAAGKSAAFVACFQRSTQGWGNGSGLAADVEGLALVVLDSRDDAGVAGKAACGFGGD